jgi:hypothetical protein
MSQLFVLHLPKQAIMDAVAGNLPSGFDQVVFSQWSEEKDAVLIGFAAGEPMEIEQEPIGGVLN